MMQNPTFVDTFAGREAIASRTEGTTYLVRIGESGPGKGGSSWGDHLFASVDEAKVYAEWVFRNHPEEVARASRAIPHQWETGSVSRLKH